MTNIEKQFPGVKALDKANLMLKKGSVHALMGENGAGKSTLMKCLFGVYVEDAGEIKIDGKPVRFTNPKQALDNGVAMVHQEPVSYTHLIRGRRLLSFQDTMILNMRSRR